MDGESPTPFVWFFLYVWAVWAAKALAARRYRPWSEDRGLCRTTVLVPVYNEPEAVFRRALAGVRLNEPTETIAVVDGGDTRTAAIAREYCDQVLVVGRSGKR